MCTAKSTLRLQGERRCARPAGSGGRAASPGSAERAAGPGCGGARSPPNLPRAPGQGLSAPRRLRRLCVRATNPPAALPGKGPGMVGGASSQIPRGYRHFPLGDPREEAACAPYLKSWWLYLASGLCASRGSRQVMGEPGVPGESEDAPECQ
jgi:hypothetical protein